MLLLLLYEVFIFFFLKFNIIINIKNNIDMIGIITSSININSNNNSNTIIIK